MLDVHRLRVFRSVVACGSIQGAAAGLGYTPSAVSQHVAALQRETGLTLLTRAGRGVRPTEAGTALAARIDGVLEQLGEIDLAIGDLRDGRTGALSLGYFASVGAAWMPSVVATLSADYPELRLELALRDGLPEDPAEWFDLQVVVEAEDFVPPAGLRAVHLLREPYVVVVPATHAVAGLSSVELGRLRPERWIDNDVFRGWCRRNLLDACRAAGFTPSFHVETHDYRTAIAFVAAGVGVTVLPRLGADGLPPGVVAVPITAPTPQRSIHAVVREGLQDHPPVAAALRVLRGRAAGSVASCRPGVVGQSVD